MCGREFLSKVLFLLFVAFLEVPIFGQEIRNQIINLSPTGSVTIDGKIGEKEWQDASRFDLSGGGNVYFKYDGAYLYVGLRSDRPGWSHLYLNEAGESADISVLHASAALGKIVYREDQNKIWQTSSNEFLWELRDPVVTAEVQKKMADYLSKNSWVASNSNMGNKGEKEFQLKPQNASNKSFQLAVVYLTDPASPQFFPATLADDTLKPTLLQGSAPKDLKFNLSQWAKINLEAKKNKSPKNKN